jgi:6-phosphogluconolactonase
MNGFDPRRGLFCLAASFAVTVVNAAHFDDPVVYAMTNEHPNNRVLAWRVGTHGTLSPVGQFPTHGSGTGTNETPGAGPVDGIDPLGSQGSLTMSADGRWLYAVNAGSATVSVFRVLRNGRLLLVDTERTLGHSPVSVTSSGRWVYVANVNDPMNGDPATVAAFSRSENGSLHPVRNGVHLLSGPTARPSQVSATPDGARVVVTERGTNAISIFPIGSGGALGDPTVTPSARPDPFGFDFAGRSTLIVSEVAMGDPAGSSASSYDISMGLTASPVSAGVLNSQMASCWTTVSPDNKRAYVTNTASDSISNYSVGTDGSITLLEPAIPTAMAPIDSGISDDGHFFFQLLGTGSAIGVYAVNASGSLDLLGTRHVALPPLGVQGIAVSR